MRPAQKGPILSVVHYSFTTPSAMCTPSKSTYKQPIVSKRGRQQPQPKNTRKRCAALAHLQTKTLVQEEADERLNRHLGGEDVDHSRRETRRRPRAIDMQAMIAAKPTALCSSFGNCDYVSTQRRVRVPLKRRQKLPNVQSSKLLVHIGANLSVVLNIAGNLSGVYDIFVPPLVVGQAASYTITKDDNINVRSQLIGHKTTAAPFKAMPA